MLSIIGELDISSSAFLGAAADDALGGGCRRLTLFLGRLGLVDVAGLRCLREVVDRAREEGVTIRLVDADEHFRRTARLAGMSSLLDGRSTAQLMPPARVAPPPPGRLPA